MGSSSEKSEGGGGNFQKKRCMVMGSDHSRECSSSSAEEGPITKEESQCPSLLPTLLGWPFMHVELSEGRNSVSYLNSVVTSAKEVGHRDEVKLRKLGSKLSATIFGQLWRLEPLPDERKSMWQREMEWPLCIGDHIIELVPSYQTFPDGRKLEAMTCRPRWDIFINLPALHKLDNVLFDILDCFKEKEFWYVDQGIIASDAAEGSASFRKTVQRQEEKWWLPVPHVPAARKSLFGRRQPYLVWKSIIESYSRVSESLAFNIVGRIGRNPELSPSSAVNLITQRKSCFPYSVPILSTPYGSAFSSPSFSPSLASFISPTRGDGIPFILNNIKPPRRGFGVRRVLNNYLGVEAKPKLSSGSTESIPSSTSSDGSNHPYGSLMIIAK